MTKTELINMDELSKADWQKILTRANQLLKDNLLNAAVQKGTADLARDMIKNLDTRTDKGKTDAPPQK